VHDLPTIRAKLQVTGAIAGAAAAGLLVLGPILGWI
jgi:hypothetical protein